MAASGGADAANVDKAERCGTSLRCQGMQRKKSFMDEFLADRWYQLDDGKPRLSEDDIQRSMLGPRGVRDQPDPARMTPQRRKKTPTDFDPGHPA
jgi:hypothetical protein